MLGQQRRRYGLSVFLVYNNKGRYILLLCFSALGHFDAFSDRLLPVVSPIPFRAVQRRLSEYSIDQRSIISCAKCNHSAQSCICLRLGFAALQNARIKQLAKLGTILLIAQFLDDALCLFIGKGFEAGKELCDVSILDIAPTIADVMGLSHEKEWEGTSRYTPQT